MNCCVMNTDASNEINFRPFSNGVFVFVLRPKPFDLCRFLSVPERTDLYYDNSITSLNDFIGFKSFF